MIEKIVVELSKRLRIVKTLSTKKENKITKFDEKGIYVETESSREKFQKGEKHEPYEFISFDFLLEAWIEFISFRQGGANDFKKSRGRSSFNMALLSTLPFVEASISRRTTTISFREFQTDELPNVQYQNVKDFLEEVITGAYNPTKLNEHYEGNEYRVKSRNRQDARLLGFINEFNELNQFQFDEYIRSENKDHYIKRILLNLGYFRVILICLDLLRSFSKTEKRVALEELGMLIVRNSRGDNLMVESVAKERTNYLQVRNYSINRPRMGPN